MSLCILLATWNGAPYLRPLLDSLQRQTLEEWQLLVRDDGSNDGTVEILAEAAATDRRIRILHDTCGRQGPAHNFALLMSEALATESPYIAFADQDDLWFPEKLERQLDRMRQAEVAHGRDMPLLGHTDLKLVDDALRVLHPSFMRWSGFPLGSNPSMAGLLIRNRVVGCTMLANRRLLELALPAPREMVMHDWWLGLLAAASGGLFYDDAPSVLYRQHASNQVGAANLSQKLRGGLFAWRPAWNRALRNFSNGVNQAHALRNRLHERGLANCASTQLVDDYCELCTSRRNVVAHLWRMHQLGIRETGCVRQGALAARVLAWRACQETARADTRSFPQQPRKIPVAGELS